jgi:hypothetical protein
LAGESAGYLVLAIADQVLNAPRLVQPAEIQLAEDGGVRVLAGRASSDADAELGLRRALDALLLVASSGSAALTRASRRTSPVGLAALVRELEAALIPVNRAAARRALARLQRETARALASGVLPDEDAAPRIESAAPPIALPSAPAAPAAASPVLPEMFALPPAAPPPVHVAPRITPEPSALVAASPVLVVSDDSLPQAPHMRAAADPSPELSLLPQWDAMLTALCEESPEVDDQSQGESDALTVALEVRASSAVEAAPSYEEDVEFDDVDVELQSAETPTVIRDAPVAPVFEAEPSLLRVDAEEVLSELPVEACTRPEPVVLRRALRPMLAEVAELTELVPLVGEIGTLTPILGSMVQQLPVLSPEQVAQMCGQVECEPSAAPLAVQPAPEAPEEQDQVLCSAANDASHVLAERAELAEPTERAPEVEPLSPGVAIVASRKSEISELLQRFQVAEADSAPGLRRAIKELAELDLTPAPFAALIR